LKVTGARSSGGFVCGDKDTRVVPHRQGNHPISARDLLSIDLAMTVRILVARSVAESLRDFASAATQAATLTGYGFLVGVMWILLAGRLH
jgi:hypothetical protein